MKTAARAVALITVMLPSAPAAAGEIWSDFDEDRVNICPAEGEFPADQVSEYIAYNVHELNKSADFHSDDGEAETASAASDDETAYRFTSDSQASLRAMVDSAEFFSRNILPPMQRVSRADGSTLDERNVTIAPPTGIGTKERMKIGFAGYLITAEDQNAVIIYNYLDALRALNEWVPVEELIDRKPLHSIRLRLAVDAFHSAYRELKPILFEAIESPSYTANLETQVWNACFLEAEE